MVQFTQTPFGQIEQVGGVSIARVRVDIGTDSQAQTLKKLTDRTWCEMARAVEGHVFDEMGESTLIISFIQRSRVNQQSQTDVSLRRGMGKHDIMKSIGEDTGADGCVGRIIRRSWLRQAARNRKNENEGKPKPRGKHLVRVNAIRVDRTRTEKWGPAD